MRGEENTSVAASAPARNSSKLNRTESLQFHGKGVEVFRVELLRVEIGGISCPEIGFFTV